jgi:hypothetical protein
MPKKDVLVSSIDSMFDDQDLCYRAGMMVCSASFTPLVTNSSSYGVSLILRSVLMKHYAIASAGGTVSCIPYVKAWCNTATDFTVRITHSGTGAPTSTVSVTSTETSKIWRQMSAINIQGAEDTVTVNSMIVAPDITIEAKRDAGTSSDYVYVQGLMVVASQIA